MKLALERLKRYGPKQLPVKVVNPLAKLLEVLNLPLDTDGSSKIEDHFEEWRLEESLEEGKPADCLHIQYNMRHVFAHRLATLFSAADGLFGGIDGN